MAQRYTSITALERMENGDCPECGLEPAEHLDDNRFWIPRKCDLTLAGVVDRVKQYDEDKEQA